jgi:quercetin dioxygenase-like cupin family protein
MNRSLGLALLLLFGGAPAAMGQDARDAVALDPTHHHVILENDHVRVFEVLGAPGDTSPMHTHPPLVVIALDKARLRVKVPDGSSSIFDLNPGMVVWFENVEHSWELLSGQLHLFAVEIKAAREGRAPAAIVPTEREAVVVDPTHHHVVMENDHVRVFEAQAAPGARSPMHTHPPTVGISFDAMRMRMTLPDGSKSIFDLHPAQAIWLANVEHSWEVLSGSLHVFGVEVKAARETSAGR